MKNKNHNDITFITLDEDNYTINKITHNCVYARDAILGDLLQGAAQRNAFVQYYCAYIRMKENRRMLKNCKLKLLVCWRVYTLCEKSDKQVKSNARIEVVKMSFRWHVLKNNFFFWFMSK